MIENNEIFTKKIESSWGGRHGYDKYFVGIEDKDEAKFYAQKNFRYRPRCGDRIQSVKPLKEGDTVEINKESYDGRFLGVVEACFPTDGWIIIISKHSCD